MIERDEWRSIRALIDGVLRGRGEYFTTGQVIKRDEKKKLIWIKELGDQAIPIVGFDYEVRYYDETPRGTTAPAVGGNNPYQTAAKKAKVTILVPKIGQTVLVAREMGTSRIPRCLGVVQGRDWVVPEG